MIEHRSTIPPATSGRPEALAAEDASAGRGFRRELGLGGLTFIALGGVIGSGWLFSALYGAQAAGPSVLISWVLAGAIILIVALVHAELGAAYPVAGGSARFSSYAFGGVAGFTTGWAVWLAFASNTPIEVSAVIQYGSNYVSGLSTTHGDTTVLTAPGIGLAILLLVVFGTVNALGLRRMRTANTGVVLWKLLVPSLAIVAFLLTTFHTGNFSAHGGFFSQGVKPIFSALSTAGIVFSFTGFEQAANYGSETRDPGRTVPRALVLAALIGIAMYVALQIVFIAALPGHSLARGWSHISFANEFGPFAGLATILGLGWLATILYVDAFVSPGGTGLVYTASTARVSYAMAREGQLPAALGRLSRNGVPAVGLALAVVVGAILFLPFPGWQKFIGFNTAAFATAYGLLPVALVVLRHRDPDRERPYRLPAARVLCPVAFVMCSLLIYWSGWASVWPLAVLMAIGYGLLIVAHLRRGADDPLSGPLAGRAALWLVPYLLALGAVSYLGQFGGGQGVIPFWWDIAVVAALSLAAYAVATSRAFALGDPPTAIRIDDPSATVQP